MNGHDDRFSPDHIDEQIEQHVWESSPAPSQSGPAQDLLRALHVLYEEEKKEDARTLDRAWSRLAAVDDQQQRNRSQQNVRSIIMKEPGSFASRQFDRPLQRPLTQRFSILLAVACLAILVGGTVFMFSTMTNGSGAPLQAAPRSTPQPTPRSTPQPTPQSTPQPTPQSTPQPTPRSTPQPTPQSTPQPTPGRK